MRRFLIWVVAPSAVASGIVSVPVVFVTLLGRWWAVAAVFGASFIAALFVGYLAWRDAIPVRRLLKLIKTTDGVVSTEHLEARETFRLPVGRPPWKK